MDLIVSPDGTIRAVYAEAIDLGVLGHLVISRASHVEPDDSGRWLADLTPVAGPVLGRSTCVAKPWKPNRPGS